MPQFAFLVLLGPLAAVYDFVTNPHAPPQICEQQLAHAMAPGPEPVAAEPAHKPRHKVIYFTRPT